MGHSHFHYQNTTILNQMNVLQDNQVFNLQIVLNQMLLKIKKL